jgi:hypothetical protein
VPIGRLEASPVPLQSLGSERLTSRIAPPTGGGGDFRRLTAATAPLLPGTLLLASLNDMLTRSAVLAQPLLFSQAIAAGSGAFSSSGLSSSDGGPGRAAAPEVELADVALPLDGLDPGEAEPAAADGGEGEGEGAQREQPRPGTDGSSGGGGAAQLRVRAVHRRTGQPEEIELPGSLVAALRQLGLARAVGYLRVVRISSGGSGGSGGSVGGGGGGGGSGAGAHPAAADGGSDSGAGSGGAGAGAGAPWLPLAVQLGVPLHNLQLCKDVCAAAVGAEFMSPASRAAHGAASQRLQAHIWQLITQYGGAGPGGGGDAAAEGGGAAPWELPPDAGLGGYAELPANNLLFDGTNLGPLDLSESQQAVAASFFAG